MDMIAPLYKLPPTVALDGVNVRRPNAYETTAVLRFVASTFSQQWADEVAVTLPRLPPTAFIATRNGQVVGFAAYDATRRNFFGPTGVRVDERGKGIGKALLIASLRAMAEDGYAYAIIGGVGPAEFYARTVNATAIPDSATGIYVDKIR